MVSSTSSPVVAVPEIALRIPGMWTGRGALARALPEGASLDGGLLRFPEAEDGVRFVPFPRDRDLPGRIRERMSRNLTAAEAAIVDEHTSVACLLGPGGSVANARRLALAALTLVNAGGGAVLVDNGNRAHGADDWREIAGDDSIQAAIAAFVSIDVDQAATRSLGMHALGRCDATVPLGKDHPHAAGMLVSVLICSCYEDDYTCEGGFCGSHDMRFVIEHEPPVVCRPNDRRFNPYGHLRLRPLPEEQP